MTFKNEIIKTNRNLNLFSLLTRKGVREVEGVDLERLYDSNVIEGSNPSLSDSFFNRMFSVLKTLYFKKQSG